jgi:hypothetical protein
VLGLHAALCFAAVAREPESPIKTLPELVLFFSKYVGLDSQLPLCSQLNLLLIGFPKKFV